MLGHFLVPSNLGVIFLGEEMVWCEGGYSTSPIDILVTLFCVHVPAAGILLQIILACQKRCIYNLVWNVSVVQGPRLVRDVLCHSVHVCVQEGDVARLLCSVNYYQICLLKIVHYKAWLKKLELVLQSCLNILLSPWK